MREELSSAKGKSTSNFEMRSLLPIPCTKGLRAGLQQKGAEMLDGQAQAFLMWLSCSGLNRSGCTQRLYYLKLAIILFLRLPCTTSC